MSILIKGIDLPKEGEHIIALIKTEGKVSYFEQDIETTTCKIMKEAKAIQIDRPHGRLIDGDKLLEEYKQWLESVPYINNTMSEMGQRIVLIDICHDLEYSAPTILEAEE